MKALRDKFNKHNNRLMDLQSQQRDLEAKLKHDYGHDGVFGALVDKCFETQVRLAYLLELMTQLPHTPLYWLIVGNLG